MILRPASSENRASFTGVTYELFVRQYLFWNVVTAYVIGAILYGAILIHGALHE